MFRKAASDASNQDSELELEARNETKTLTGEHIHMACFELTSKSLS